MISPMHFPIDYQDLIYSNCSMVLGDRCEIDIASQLDDAGTWTAHVLMTEKGKRTAIFSESSSALSGALEALHRKSAMAVNQYIATNGFDLPPRLSSRTARRTQDHRPAYTTALDESEIISLNGHHSDSSSSGGDDDDDKGLSSDSEDESALSKAPRRAARTAHRPHMAVRRPEGYIHGIPGAYRATHDLGGRPPYASYLPIPPAATTSMPPAFAHKQQSTLPAAPRRMQGIPAPVSGGVAPPSLLQQQQQHCAPIHAHGILPPPPRYSGMLMCITWVGHGELSILDQCCLSVFAIRARAHQLVRERAADFRDTGSINISKTPLVATVKRFHIGNKAYELANFQGNLSALFDTSPVLPAVDIEVRDVPLPPSEAGDVVIRGPKIVEAKPFA
jgi:hypothetical protein